MKWILILLLLFSYSCKKQRHVNVSGRVYNPITGKGIPDIKMYIWKTGGGIPGGEQTLYRAYTDADGYYSFQVKKLGAVYMSISLGEDYHPVAWVVNGEEKGGSNQKIVKGNMMNVDFKAVGYGMVVLDIKAVNCEGSTDVMKFRKKYQFGEFESYSSERDGCYSYTSPEPFELPEGNYDYEVLVIRPSGTQTYTYNLNNSSSGIDTLKLYY